MQVSACGLAFIYLVVEGGRRKVLWELSGGQEIRKTK